MKYSAQESKSELSLQKIGGKTISHINNPGSNHNQNYFVDLWIQKAGPCFVTCVHFLRVFFMFFSELQH